MPKIDPLERAFFLKWNKDCHRLGCLKLVGSFAHEPRHSALTWRQPERDCDSSLGVRAGGILG
jgi:hypothetical protein